MSLDRPPVFKAVGGLVPGIWNIPGAVAAMDAVLDLVPNPPTGELSERAVIEIVEHEAIVQEAYKDSRGVWTWSVGITGASGHNVAGYKDNPQTLEHCLAVYVWLLRERYLPDVRQAFNGHVLAEHQLAAALSFHWNTGAILHASWVALWRGGQVEPARAAIMNWTANAELVSRRKAERNLFFDGAWIGDGTVTVWPVKKPAYTPDWKHPELVDIRAAVKEAMA